MIKQRNFWMLILLTIVTCGIYGIVFWYQWVEDVNKMSEGCSYKSPNYIVVLLLGVVTCGIYTIVWYYKMGNLLAESGSKRGLTIKENGTSMLLWIILGSFLFGIGPLVASYLMISNTNAIADAYNKQNA